MANSIITQANVNDSQINIVYDAFFECPKTMMEVEKETNINRSNICRYVETLNSKNMISLVSYRKCKITKSDGVGEYTTNPEFFVKSNQLELF